MIGLGQEDEIEEITLRPEIWWHDAVYHETDDCMKWLHSFNVCIFFYLGQLRVLSFSEILVSRGSVLSGCKDVVLPAKRFPFWQ